MWSKMHVVLPRTTTVYMKFIFFFENSALLEGGKKAEFEYVKVLSLGRVFVCFRIILGRFPYW